MEDNCFIVLCWLDIPFKQRANDENKREQSILNICFFLHFLYRYKLIYLLSFLTKYSTILSEVFETVKYLF